MIILLKLELAVVRKGAIGKLCSFQLLWKVVVYSAEIVPWRIPTSWVLNFDNEYHTRPPYAKYLIPPHHWNVTCTVWSELNWMEKLNISAPYHQPRIWGVKNVRNSTHIFSFTIGEDLNWIQFLITSHALHSNQSIRGSQQFYNKTIMGDF